MKEPCNVHEKSPSRISFWINKIIRNYYKDMAFPLEHLNERTLERLSERLVVLQRGLTGKRELSGFNYMDDDTILPSYYLYYWPSSYTQVSYAIKAIQNRIGKKPNATFLDVGCGPGSATCALLDNGFTHGVALDKSTKSLTFLQKLLPNPEKVKMIKTDTNEKNIDAVVSHEGPYDVIVFSHSLNEMTQSVNQKKLIVQKYSTLLKDDGILLIIEPALLATSRDLLYVRDSMLLDGFKVIAPCFYQGECPALKKNDHETCHSEIEWEIPPHVKEMARRANLDRGNLKMTYIAMSKKGNIQEHNYLRVISDPILNKGGKIRYFVCGQEGRFTISAKPELVPKTALQFNSLKREDIILLENTVSTENGLGITENTKLTLALDVDEIK